MNFQTCLCVTLTCDINITSNVTGTVLTQGKLGAEVVIHPFIPSAHTY